jgi:hypothetical protein
MRYFSSHSILACTARAATAPALIVLVLMSASCGAAPSAKTAAPPNWLTYKNDAAGYSISYPKDWKIDLSFTDPQSPPGQEIHGVAFGIPESLTRGTNLSADQTTVSVEALPLAGGCDAHRFLPDGENMRAVTENGRTWSVADSGEGAAGNFYDTTVYALATKTQCLAVHYTIHSTNIGNYDPGSVKAFDAKSLTATFDRIRRSLRTGR